MCVVFDQAFASLRGGRFNQGQVALTGWLVPTLMLLYVGIRLWALSFFLFCFFYILCLGMDRFATNKCTMSADWGYDWYKRKGPTGHIPQLTTKCGLGHTWSFYKSSLLILREGRWEKPKKAEAEKLKVERWWTSARRAWSPWRPTWSWRRWWTTVWTMPAQSLRQFLGKIIFKI